MEVDKILENAPTWLIIGYILIQSITRIAQSEVFSKILPDSIHQFINDKNDKREFKQSQERQVLRSQLKDAQSRQERSDNREREIFQLFKELVEFVKITIVSKIDNHDERMINKMSELISLLEKISLGLSEK